MKMSKPQISMLYHQLLAPPRCTGTEHYRHELKYLISWADKAELTARMSPILKLDPQQRTAATSFAAYILTITGTPL